MMKKQANRRPEAIEYAHNVLLEGLASVEETAAAIGRDKRTVARLVQFGVLPSVKIGATRYIILAGAREAIMATADDQTTDPTLQRGRGRPRKQPKQQVAA